MERSAQRILDQPEGALFSKDRKKRYLLWRRFNTGDRYLHFIMLNPSNADESFNDPTITRCINFAREWNYDGMLVTNLFSYRTPYPDELKTNETNLSRQNKQMIEFAMQHATKTICAWGNHGRIHHRSKKLMASLNANTLYCFDINQNGEPKHPLYVRKDADLIVFNGDIR
jgi:hypothetical protein